MQLHLDTNKRELKSHGTYEFPVNVNYEQLSRYERKSFLWHWHKEIELTLILQGEINYQINDTIYHLKEGDGLFCNSNALHTGFAYRGLDCIYISTTFHPRFLYGYENSILQTKYTDHLIDTPALAGLSLSPSVPWQKEILGGLSHIWEISQKPPASYEMQLHLALAKVWLLLWENTAFDQTDSDIRAPKNMDRLKTMLSYIQNHYTEKITLADIAEAVNICQSECCRFFKKHMKESLFDYLLSFRIEKVFRFLPMALFPSRKLPAGPDFPALPITPKFFVNEWDAHPASIRKLRNTSPLTYSHRNLPSCTGVLTHEKKIYPPNHIFDTALTCSVCIFDL